MDTGGDDGGSTSVLSCNQITELLECAQNISPIYQKHQIGRRAAYWTGLSITSDQTSPTLKQ